RQKDKEEAQASLKKSEAQPQIETPSAKVVELKPVEPEPKRRELRRVNGVWYEVIGPGDLRRWFGAEPKIAPQIELKPQTQAKPEPEPEKIEHRKEEETKSLPALVPAIKLSPADWDDAIAAMNRQHAIVENVGGKAMIASWEPSSYNVGKLM